MLEVNALLHAPAQYEDLRGSVSEEAVDIDELNKIRDIPKELAHLQGQYDPLPQFQYKHTAVRYTIGGTLRLKGTDNYFQVTGLEQYLTQGATAVLIRKDFYDKRFGTETAIDPSLIDISVTPLCHPNPLETTQVALNTVEVKFRIDPTNVLRLPTGKPRSVSQKFRGALQEMMFLLFVTPQRVPYMFDLQIVPWLNRRKPLEPSILVYHSEPWYFHKSPNPATEKHKAALAAKNQAKREQIAMEAQKVVQQVQQVLLQPSDTVQQPTHLLHHDYAAAAGIHQPTQPPDPAMHLADSSADHSPSKRLKLDPMAYNTVTDNNVAQSLPMEAHAQQSMSASLDGSLAIAGAASLPSGDVSTSAAPPAQQLFYPQLGIRPTGDQLDSFLQFQNFNVAKHNPNTQPNLLNLNVYPDVSSLSAGQVVYPLYPNVQPLNSSVPIMLVMPQVAQAPNQPVSAPPAGMPVEDPAASAPQVAPPASPAPVSAAASAAAAVPPASAPVSASVPTPGPAPTPTSIPAPAPAIAPVPVPAATPAPAAPVAAPSPGQANFGNAAMPSLWKS